MRTILTLLILLVLTEAPQGRVEGSAAAAAQEATPECTCKPREVGESGSRRDSPHYNKGVQWHRSLDEAVQLAKASGKLVFYYHVVGDLDKEGC